MIVKDLNCKDTNFLSKNQIINQLFYEHHIQPPSFLCETTPKNAFSTQKASEELFPATQKEESTTQKPLTTTQNLYTSE